MEQTPLGKNSPYIEHYSPELLVAIEREPIRKQLNINTDAMHGVDIWNHWEVSFLNNHGKPQIACLSIQYDASSIAIVESKSLKLYFNSLNQTQFANLSDVIERVKIDIESQVKSPVTVNVLNDSCLNTDWINDYQCLDDLDVECHSYQPNADYLMTEARQVNERLYSELFKTNCMVTGQPDWASVFIDYHGPKINHEGLLQYLISFRNHQAFHEPSCEMIFSDLMLKCLPQQLSVYCRYTRRGGIDINPYRTTNPSVPENLRILRQ